MTDWTAGYVADVPYTYGYYPEQNPARIPLTFLMEGLAPPPIAVACELGFGQGMSVNIHAAASGIRWYGTDFNPTQVAFARRLLDISGTEARLSDESFAEYAARTDLPDFDMITLHGVWSWVTEENRAALVDFIRRRLKIGGVLQISYNAKPGWAAMLPVRELLVLHAETMGMAGDSVLDRVDRAMGFADRLLAANGGYFRANPVVAERMKALRDQPRAYLAHEYFNREWLPTSFADLARALAPARLSYACSATHLDRIDGLHLTPEQQAVLAEIHDPVFREVTRDLLVNAGFRRDYWVKGVVRLSPPEQAEGLDRIRLMLAVSPDELVLKVPGALGEAVLTETIYRPVIDFMADGPPRSLLDIRTEPSLRAIAPGQLMQALTMLIGKGDLQPVRDDAAIAAARPHTDRLNRHLLAQSPSHGQFGALASPVTGGGVRLERLVQLFMLAHLQGHKAAPALAQFALSHVPIPAEEHDGVTSLAEGFLQRRLPVLQAMGVV